MLPKASVSPHTNVASDVIATGIEAGYDLFHIAGLQKKCLQTQKLYLFARYEFYDSMFKTAVNIPKEDWCRRQVFFAGFNYYPLKQIGLKAEYSYRKFSAPYNNEPSINIGIVYSGMFL